MPLTLAEVLRDHWPGFARRHRTRLAAAHYRSMGIGLFETGSSWWLADHRLPPCEILGREHLEAAQKLPSNTPELMEIRDRSVLQARGQLHVANRG